MKSERVGFRRWIGVVALVAGCAGSGAPRPPPAPAPSPEVVQPTPIEPAPPDPYRDQLNLDFEQVEAGQVKGWRMLVDGKPAEVTPEPEAHRGAAAVRLVGGAQIAVTSTTVDAEPMRGKRVRLSGWVRTKDVAGGWAGLWLRVDGGKEMVLDNMQDRGLTGTADWREITAVADVPADGVTLVLGALVVGPGTAWVDDLRIELVPVPASEPIAIGGVVRDAAGAAVEGAQVALIGSPMSDVAAIAVTGADGRFRFDTVVGRWGLSAHHAAGVGAFADARQIDATTDDVTLTLGRDGGVTVRGKVTGGGPAGGHAVISPYSQHDSDVFAIPVAADGTFTAVLPRGDSYGGSLRGTLISSGQVARAGDVVDVVLDASVLSPAPPEIAAWIRKRGVPIATAEPGTGVRDLTPLRKAIGKARIVALGEATHGTREFFQLKHRLVEYLVGELGFTVFAIEANQPECRAINAYVVDGQGDARAALAGIYFWTWNTEEVLAMIEWMRTWNADPRHRKKVRFTGFDMQATPVALAGVAAYLRTVAPDDAEALLAPLAPYGEEGRGDGGPDAHGAVSAGLTALVARFASEEKAWAGRDQDAYAVARQDLRVLEQANRMFVATGPGSFEARDVAMADNVDWILSREPRGTRVVLWAHNGHVGRTMGGMKNMGSHLAQRHAKDYVVVGFGFGQGSFQALDWTGGKKRGLAEHTLGPPPAWDVSVPFTASGHPIVAVDLRAATGTVARWFASAHPMRDTGAVFSTEEAMSQPEALRERYDLVIFVASTTRARPLAAPAAPPPPKPPAP